MNAPPVVPKSLRRRLFGSHLLVMVVTLGVLFAGIAVVMALAEVGGIRGGLGRGKADEGNPAALMFGLASAVAASALVSWRVAKRLAAPIESVRAATRELAAGRYGARVPASDTAELDQLAADVNTLAEELRTTEERRLRLIGDVAHELRNPLSTIEGTMEALIDGVVAADDDTFARVGREASRLRRLADDLSSLSSAGELGLVDRAPIDLTSLVGGVVEQLEPQAVAKGITLDWDPAGRHVVSGDADRLTQVVTNVIGNAVAYTPEGGVRVRVDRRAVRVDGEPSTTGGGDSVMVEVTDTGIGLAAHDLDRIFERFHRVDDHYRDGTGVGLAIAKLIVDAHDGTITAHSDGLGQGSTFRIELPAG